MPEWLLVNVDERGVCTLTLNRPERRNAFDSALVTTLLSRLLAIHADRGVRVVVLTGAGDSFCSGADLESMRRLADAPEDENREDARRLAELMSALSELNQPTIARINGPAHGGGAGLVACCDIAVASQTAVFSFPELRLGLAPAVIAPYVLAALGARQARRFLLTGEPISAGKALDIGLIHALAEHDGLDAAVAREVDSLLRAAPEAVAAFKQLLGRLSRPSAELREETAALIARLRASSEGREGLRAFRERRKPRWEP